MNQHDSEQDADILFTATTSPSISLSVDANTQLYIWSEKEFAPGGNITLEPGGSGDEWDGSLKICSTSTFTGSETATYSIGGSWIASSTATFTASSSTVTFTATTTGKTIATADNPFYNLTFNGSGGGWTFSESNATTTNDFTITAGSVTSTSGILIIGGSYANADNFYHNSGKVEFIATTTGKTINSGGTGTGKDFHEIEFSGSSGGWTFSASTNAVTSTVNVASVGLIFNAGSTFTFTNINWDGQASTTRLTLRSSSIGTQWNLIVNGNQSVLSVDAQDSNACSGDNSD